VHVHWPDSAVTAESVARSKEVNHLKSDKDPAFVSVKESLTKR
jgi:hypothetical protein